MYILYIVKINVNVLMFKLNMFYLNGVYSICYTMTEYDYCFDFINQFLYIILDRLKL